MTKYHVVVTRQAEEMIHDHIEYIYSHLCNPQAAEALYNEIMDTVYRLEDNAGVFRLCDNSNLGNRGLHKLPLAKHNYILLFRIENDMVFVDYIFHEKQDYESILK